jgi:F-type H+-transporting ATPase subunit b
MAVDWFTVVAQLVNFLILVFLLQRFLYRPIRAAMDDREKLVAAQFAEAAQAREQAEKEKKEWDEKSSSLEAERAAVLERVRVESEANRLSLQKAADTEATEQAERWRVTQASAEADFARSLERRAQLEALLLTRGLIPAFSGVELEARAIELFLARLDALPPEETARLHTGLIAGPVLVSTALEPSDATRKELAGVLLAKCPESLPAVFKVDPTLLCGVELSAGDWKLRWSIGDYLTNLETQVARGTPQEVNTHGG